MKVIHVLDHSIPLQSGYSFRTRAIVREQRAMGWETFHVTSPKHSAATASDEVVDGLRFFRTSWQPEGLATLPGLRELGLMRALEHRLEEIALEIKPDLLHAHSPVLNALPALWVGRRLGIPVVYEVRAFWEDAAVDHGTHSEWGMRYRMTRALETWALRRVDHIFTICEGLRKDILRRGIRSDDVTTIPNAVDLQSFGLGGEPDPLLRQQLELPDGPVLGFVGSFYAYEGLELLISALPQIAESVPSVGVLLVGGGPEEARLRAQAAILPSGCKVTFTGRVSHRDVARYYDLIDVLVYPRHSMRLTELVTPLKPLEAMAQGKLVVASDVGGHRELIAHERTGILFTADDATALARALVELVSDRGRWPTLKEAARRFVETERSWAETAKRYRSPLEKLLAEKGRGSVHA